MSSPSTPWPSWVGALVHQGTEAVAALDATGTLVYANPATALLLSTTLDALLGTSVIDLVHPEDLARAGAVMDGVSDGARPSPGLLRVRQGDGTWRFLELGPAAIDLPAPPHGPGPVTVVTVRDNELQEAHWHFLTAISSGIPFQQCLEALAVGLSNHDDGDLLIAFDDEGYRSVAGLLDPSLAGATTDGGLDQTPGTPWATSMVTGEPCSMTVDELPEPVRTLARSLGRAAVVTVPVPDPGSDRAAIILGWTPNEAMAPIVLEALVRRPRQAVLLALDRRHDLAQLEYLAHVDGLTGAANRQRFFDVVGGWSERGQAFGVVYIDLDRFKPVNDSFGHAVGDRVLAGAADRLRTTAGPGALVARLGGDEFAVAIRQVDDDDLESLAARMVAAVSEPLDVGGRVVAVGASAGCARSQPEEPVDATVARADAALYEVKRTGRSTRHHEPTA